MNKHRVQFIIFISFLAAVMLVVSSVGAAPSNNLIVTLSAAQSEFTASQEVLVDVTISNPTGHTQHILRWFTPENGLEEPIFTIKVDGESVAYTGAIYKRPAATGGDYLSIKAGESVTYTVNLEDYYDLSTTGEYEIAYGAASTVLYSVRGSEDKGQDSLTSESIKLAVDGRLSKGKPTPPPPPPPGTNGFNACSATQQSALINARSEATNYSLGAENYLQANTQNTRYTEWFGLYTPSRYDTVHKHFTALHDAWTNAGVNFDCSCKQNYYAYVYPTRPYVIYLCKVFWTAPLTGTDSKAGTLIHEMSHFNVVASTNDYVYGQTGARNLALTDPNKAINNADNHEYFAENHPSLP